MPRLSSWQCDRAIEPTLTRSSVGTHVPPKEGLSELTLLTAFVRGSFPTTIKKQSPQLPSRAPRGTNSLLERNFWGPSSRGSLKVSSWERQTSHSPQNYSKHKVLERSPSASFKVSSRDYHILYRNSPIPLFEKQHLLERNLWSYSRIVIERVPQVFLMGASNKSCS
jgi:hypothetical protein